jgi:two-component system chemotaxis response regulator CheY
MERKWILIVDDEPDIRQNIAELIQAHNSSYSVILAKDGSEAIIKMGMQKFDCVITDLNMPKVDGADLIHALKNSRDNSATPIIIVTAFPDEKLIKIYSFLSQLDKPFKSAELLALIDKQIALGPINKRMPAQLLNGVLSSFLSSLEESKLSPVPTAPVMRGKNDEIMGDRICILNLRFRESAQFWFTLGFESKFNADTIVDIFLKNAHSSPRLKGELNIVTKVLIQRNQLQAGCLEGYKGLRFKIATTEGSAYLESIVGQEVVLKYMQN